MKTKKEESARRDAFIEEAFLTQTDDCIIWIGALGGGKRANYPTINRNGRKKYVTRIICEMAHGSSPEPGLDVAHACNNTACINKKHLRWDTRKGNMADTILPGHRKLTEQQVREIRAQAGSVPRSVIAEQYGINKWNVGLIINRKTWRQLE